MARRGRIAILATFAALSATDARGGDVIGTVRFTGPVPARPAVTTTKDRSVCGDEVEDESLLVSDGRLANVAIALKGAPAPPPATLVLDQRRCRYRPRVQVAPVGSTLEIRNSDPVLHSVHGWEGRRSLFEVVTPSEGMRVPTRLGRTGLIQIRCDVHSWMVAYVLVADGPAAVTGADGTFALRGIPAGSYVVTAWHERLGERTLQVTVPDRGEARVDLSYGG